MRTIVLILSYFFIYSLLGWCLESLYASVKAHHFTKRRGAFTTYFLPLYGVCAVLIIGLFHTVSNKFFAALISGVVVTALEYLVGWVLDQELQLQLWDYSNYKWQLGGYICLPFTLLWCVLAYVLAVWVHPYIALMVRSWAPMPQLFIVMSFVILYAFDFVMTERHEVAS